MSSAMAAMTEKMQRLDLYSDRYKGIEMVTKCKDCKYYHACNDFDNDGCNGCPMHYSSRFSVHHCHCTAYATRDELKQKRCKFFVQREDKE